MKKFRTLKKIGFGLLLTFPFIFIYLTFANSKDCDQLVIDTYEIHSNINIPKIKQVNCHYDENEKVRISIYELVGSLSESQFVTVDHNNALNLLSGNHLLNEDEFPISDQLQIATGKKWGRKWTYLYEQQTGRLWAELKY